jgi:hypothetical protein
MRKGASALHVGKDSVEAASLGVARCEMTLEWNWRRVDRRLFVRRCAFAQESNPAAFSGGLAAGVAREAARDCRRPSAGRRGESDSEPAGLHDTAMRYK